MTSTVHYALIVLAAWTVYFAVHSLLASLRVKTWVAVHQPRFMPFYRLTYNAVALLLLMLPLGLTLAWRGPLLWRWEGLWGWVADGLALAAMAGFVWTLRDYDGGEFLGLRQWRRGDPGVADQERFQISPLHRFVRHPWYTLGLVMVWTRDMDLLFLISSLMITLYLVVGARLEERKLLVYHGEVYGEYRRRVPALIPRPWRYLDRATAAALVARARNQQH